MNEMTDCIRKIETPFFIIDKEELDALVQEMEESLKLYWNNAVAGYSFKTNSLPWIVNFFRDKGFYAEVVSDDEYNLAKYFEFKDNHIIYNGIIKSKVTFLDALENDCIVNIDSFKELKWLQETNQQKNYSVGVRVNFDLEKICPGETQCGDDGGRFGFCYENGELKKILEILAHYENIEVKGLHLHCSSKTRSLEIYKAISNMACKIKREFNLSLDYVDIGGGFFGGLENKPHFKDYLKCVSDILSKEFDKEKTKLIIEPGMSLIGAPVSFVTSVIDVKKTNRNRFVITDGSRNNIDPLMTKSSYFYEVDYLNEKNIEDQTDKQIIAGYTCMEHDRLFEMKEHRKLVEGDRIIYHKVGAYTMCLSPLFIKYFPPVYVKDGNDYQIVRKKWGVEEYIQNGTW